jgi:multiple sugar transport system substrate-binding protein
MIASAYSCLIPKWARWLLLLLLTSLISLSCQSPWQPTRDRPITLKLSGWSASPVEARLLQQVLHQFEASHPGIQVRFETIADQYMDVIKTRLIGDAGPDVFYLDALEAPFLMEQAVLEPLDAYITPDFDLADFEPRLLNAFRHRAHLYGLPKDYSTLALFYNLDALKAAGIAEPPRTWDELEAAARLLTQDTNQDRKPEQYGLGLTPELARLVYVIQAYGGQVLDHRGYATFASEPALKGLARLVQQYRQDRTAAQPSDVGSSSGSEMFGRGRAAMVIEGAWAIPYLQESFPQLRFATAEVPLMGDRPSTMVFTVAYVMNARSRHKQAAWELIAYLTGKTGMQQWTRTGFALPTRKSVAAQLQYDRAPLRAPLVAGVAYATPWQLGRYPAAILNNFNNQFASAFLGQQPLPQAMQKAQDEANEQIQAAQD